MATAPETLIGTTVSLIASVPAAETISAYEALSFIELGKVVAPVPEINESSSSNTLTLLKTGVTQHYNGAKILNPFDLSYVYQVDDAGQVIVRENANENNEVSLKIEYPDGKIKYLQAVLGDLRTMEATENSYHGEMINVRPITIAVTDDGSGA